MEAQNLIAKDNFMGGMMKGKSDPYVKIRVGGITFRSHTIKENLNPVWNELYEVLSLLKFSLRYSIHLIRSFNFRLQILDFFFPV